MQTCAERGVATERVLSDNGSPYISHLWRDTGAELGIKHSRTRPRRPQTNGKAERFIQSALREWAYGRSYQHSDERRAALPVWTHFYNWHRQHHGIQLNVPVSRLAAVRKNVLTLHT